MRAKVASFAAREGPSPGDARERAPTVSARTLLLCLAALTITGRTGACGPPEPQASQAGPAGAAPAPDAGAARQVRLWFQLPGLFDFGAYQKAYRKSYKSAAEQSARLAVYLARSWRVFVSAVNYRHHHLNYYLGINARSDWTPEEIEALQNRLVEPVAPLAEQLAHPSAPAEPVDEGELADLEEGEEWRASLPAGQPVTWRPFLGIQSDPDYRPLDSVTLKRGQARHYDQLGGGRASAQRSRGLSRLAHRLGRKLGARFKKTAEAEEEPRRPDEVWVNHQRSGCLAPVQDQGLCGACYIFATLAYLEWAHCRETGGPLVKFSEQYLVDCGAGQGLSGLYGCAHGLVTQVGVFANNFGLETAHGYGRDYAARAHQCPYNPGAPLRARGALRLDLASLIRVPLEHLEAVLEDAPLVVNIGTSRELYEYGGGVFDGRNCSREGHHSVLLIGHGRENGEEYWLLRNSESSSYGESGHLRLSKSSQCITPPMGFMFGRYTPGRGVKIMASENAAKQVAAPA